VSRAARRTTRTLGGAAALAAVIALAGCTSSSASGPKSPAPSSNDLTQITPIPSSAASTAVSSSPAPVTSPSTKPPSSAPVKPTLPGLATCTSAQLGIRVLRGGALAGQEIALITFTNTSATKCAMFGYPGVSLRLHGALLGQPAERSIKKPKTVPLAPGAAAETTITDFSSCQAPISDTVRIYAPDQKPFVDKALDLRGCRLFIDPVRPSS
jgi:Protein of unknown function (DUF4232)